MKDTQDKLQDIFERYQETITDMIDDMQDQLEEMSTYKTLCEISVDTDTCVYFNVSKQWRYVSQQMHSNNPDIAAMATRIMDKMKRKYDEHLKQ